MNENERIEMRVLQNKVVASAERTGLPDDYKTNCRDSNNHEITIGDLRKYIYPQFKQVFEDYIAE